MLVRLPLIFLIIRIHLTNAKVQKYNPDLKYTKISYTAKTHELCMNDCVDAVCAVWSSYYYDPKYCYPGNELAPIYYTAQFLHKKATCLSRCDYYTYKYQWCYVDNDENWDYCNSQTHTELIQSEETVMGFLCMDKCAEDGYTYTCSVKQGSKQECLKTKFIIKQEYTAYGERCVGACKMYLKSYSCELIYKYGLCAPSAEPRIPEIFGTLSLPDCKEGKLEECGFKKMVDVIEKAPYFEMIKVNESTNPVKSYTIKHGEDRLGFGYNLLPLVIRATVSKQTLRRVNGVLFPDIYLSVINRNVDLMKKHDEDVHVSLISYRMGGRNETFNVIPLHASVKEKIVILQDTICETVLHRKYKAVVEVTVLVTYTSDKKVDVVIYSMDYYKDGQFDMNILVTYENKEIKL